MKLTKDFVPQNPRQKAFMTAFTRTTLRGESRRLSKTERSVFTNYLKRLQTAFSGGVEEPPVVPSMP